MLSVNDETFSKQDISLHHDVEKISNHLKEPFPSLFLNINPMVKKRE
jgi:hypothetical protein